MREIKFRAWDKKNKRYLTIDEFSDYILYAAEGCDGRGLHTVWLGGIADLKNVEWLQYTSLKDKNGKEIYEGDILLIPDEYTEPILDDGSGPREEANHLAPIVFKDGQFGVDIQESADIFKKGFTSFQTLEWEDGLVSEQQLEVIGNIYENPELLESKE